MAAAPVSVERGFCLYVRSRHGLCLPIHVRASLHLLGLHGLHLLGRCASASDATADTVSASLAVASVSASAADAASAFRFPVHGRVGLHLRGLRGLRLLSCCGCDCCLHHRGVSGLRLYVRSGRSKHNLRLPVHVPISLRLLGIRGLKQLGLRLPLPCPRPCRPPPLPPPRSPSARSLRARPPPPPPRRTRSPPLRLQRTQRT